MFAPLSAAESETGAGVNLDEIFEGAVLCVCVVSCMSCVCDVLCRLLRGERVGDAKRNVERGGEGGQGCGGCGDVPGLGETPASQASGRPFGVALFVQFRDEALL